VVADASALIAIRGLEPGWEAAYDRLSAGAVISAVNWSEVTAWSLARGATHTDIGARLAQLPLAVIPFTREHAERAASLREATRTSGLGLGDRACLALALALNAAVVITADRRMAEPDVGVQIQLLR
jgi:PIN domain nuclease of toxin-antitoxin system